MKSAMLPAREYVPFDVLHGAKPEPVVPKVAGLAVVAADTGRVLMIQRAYDEKDPAGGMLEFPGGHIDDGETPLEAACREWCEETGLDLPRGEVIGEWKAGGGKYCGYVYEMPREGKLDILEGRDASSNPDADNDLIEVIMWLDCEYLSEDNPALRKELRESLGEVAKALPKTQRVRAAEVAVFIVDTLTGGRYTPGQRVARSEFLRAAVRRPRVPQPPLGPPVIPPPPRGKRWRDFMGRYTWSPGASRAEIERVQEAFQRRPSAAMPKPAPPRPATVTDEDMPDVFNETMAAVAARRMRPRTAIALFEGQARQSRIDAGYVQSIGAPGEAERIRARLLAQAERYEQAIEELRAAPAKPAPVKKAAGATNPPKRTTAPGYHVGFTGTREGMTPAQREAFRARMAEIKASHPDAVFHYGQAIGADAEAAQIARELGFRVVSHPSNLTAQTARLVDGAEARPPKAPLDRNRDIVAASDVVLATPRTATEQLRSGTWATIRQARRTDTPLELLSPAAPAPLPPAPAKKATAAALTAADLRADLSRVSELDSMRLADLKTLAAELGIPKSQTKPKLIAAIRDRVAPPSFQDRVAAAAKGEEALAAVPFHAGFTEPTSTRLMPDLDPDVDPFEYESTLAFFADEGSGDINDALRFPNDSAGAYVWLSTVRELDETIAGSVLDRDVVAFRGVGRAIFRDPTEGRPDSYPDDVPLPDDLVGFTWRDRAYISATANRGVAEEFAGNNGDGVLIRMVLPKGTPAVALSEWEYEAELLLPRDATFRIVAVHDPETVMGFVQHGPSRQRPVTIQVVDVEVTFNEPDPNPFPPREFERARKPGGRFNARAYARIMHDGRGVEVLHDPRGHTSQRSWSASREDIADMLDQVRHYQRGTQPSD